MGAKPGFQVKNYYFTEKALRIINNHPWNGHPHIKANRY